MHQGSIWFVWAHGICKEQRLWVPFATLQEATDDDVDKDDVDDDDDDLDDAVDVIVALVVVIVFFVVILLQEKCWRGRAKKKKGARSILQSQPSEGAPCVLAAKKHLAEHQPDNSQQSADLLKQSYVFYRESVVT